MTKSERNIVLVTGVPGSGASLVSHMLASGGMSVFRAKVDHPPDVQLPDEQPSTNESGMAYVRVTPNGLLPAIGGAVWIDHDLLYALPRGGFEYHLLLAERSLEEIIEHKSAMARSHGTQINVRLLSARIRGQQALIDDWLEHRPQIRVWPVQFDHLQRDATTATAAIDYFLGGGLDRCAMAQAAALIDVCKS